MAETTRDSIMRWSEVTNRKPCTRAVAAIAQSAGSPSVDVTKEVSLAISRVKGRI